MLLTITTTYQPATDLGYLLHKNPAKLHSFELSFGKAHVFYPEATAERCTAALLLDVDPVALSRGRHGSGGPPLEPYVNDRPYVASSFGPPLPRCSVVCEEKHMGSRSVVVVGRDSNSIPRRFGVQG